MNVKKILPALAVMLLLAACADSDKKDLEAKKKELADYKTQLKDLSSKIETLEKDIAKLDTTFKIEQKPKLVQIDVLKKQDFKHYLEVEGTVDAEQNVTVLPQQPGIVTEIYVKVGDHVTKGQLLAITATTGTVKDNLQAAETQLSLAETAYDKQKALWDQKIGSEIQYLQAKTTKEAAEKNIDGVKKQLEMTKAIAPINGTVDAMNLRVGDMAAPSQLMPGIRIINDQSLKVKAKLADSDLGKVSEGDKAQIRFPDINKTVEIPITYVSRTIDPRSRTFGIEAKLANDKNEYAANLIARLKINDETIKNAILVPSNVIQTSADGDYVITAQLQNGVKTASKKMIIVGPDYNGQTVITSGLKEGDQIITFGYTEVVDGQRIDF